MAITTNLRTTLIEGINLNQGRDFSDVGAGNVTNILGFTDDFSQLSLTPTGTGNLILSRGESFVAYNKNNDDAFMKCQLTQNYSQPFLEIDGTYFLWLQIVPALVTTGSAALDGSDMFSIEWGAALPVSGFYYPLFEFSLTGSDIAIVNDLRLKRSVEFDNIQVDGNVNIDGDLNVNGRTDLTNQTYIDGDILTQYITDAVAATSGGSSTSNFTLGEDFVNVGPREGAMFLGKGQTSIQSLSTNGNQIFGDVVSSEKVRVHFDNTVDTGSNNIANFSFWINKVGIPVDDIDFQLFEGVTPIASDLVLTQVVIDGTQQTHVTGRAWFDSKLSEKYIEVRRSGALDAINHYSIQRDNVTAPAGVTYEVFNGGIWTLAAGSLRFVTTFGFEKDKAYKSDPRGIEGEDIRGKALQAGIAGEVKTFYIAGIIDHVAVNPNLEYKEYLLVDKILDDIQIDSYGDFLLGLSGQRPMAGDGGPNERVGQTITMTEDYFYKFDVNLTKANNPIDGVLARAYDAPGGILLATSTNIIDASDILTFSPIVPRPLLTFEFDGINRGTGNSIYIELDRTGVRDVGNSYTVIEYSGSIPFPTYAGGDAIVINNGIPLILPEDLIFTSYQSSSYIKETGLYDINKLESVIETGSGVYVGNQISNGLFSLEISEEQHEKSIKQVDVQIGSILFGLGVASFEIPYDLGVEPREIQVSLMPPNIQNNVSTSGMSKGVWTRDGQTCVYSFGDSSNGTQYESGSRSDKIGVIHRSRTSAVREIEILSVDKEKVVIGGAFEGFYQLTFIR